MILPITYVLDGFQKPRVLIISGSHMTIVKYSFLVLVIKTNSHNE